MIIIIVIIIEEVVMLLKTSRHREKIKEILAVANYHPTVEELYMVLKPEYPKLSLATVYRNLEQLCQTMEIWKIEMPGSPARYDGNMEKHFHKKCVLCGSITDVFPNTSLDDVIASMIDDDGFDLKSYKIDFLGLCDKCK